MNAVTRIATLKERQQRVERGAALVSAGDVQRFLRALNRAMTPTWPRGSERRS